MMALFPELEGSLNIVFQNASSKSNRRFKDAHKSPSQMLISRDLWDEISLDGLIRKHNKEVTHLYMTKVPSLLAKFDNVDRKKRNNGQFSALRAASNGELRGLTEKELDMVKKYIHLNVYVMIVLNTTI